MITDCICHKISFSDILELAKVSNLNSLEEIKERKKICDKCCLCNRYVEEILKTGKTKFSLDYFG